MPGTFWFGRFDAMKKMDHIEEANAGIAAAMARPMECVFNTMPKALFHRARLDDEKMVHFLSRLKDETKIKRAGYNSGHQPGIYTAFDSVFGQAKSYGGHQRSPGCRKDNFTSSVCQTINTHR